MLTSSADDKLYRALWDKQPLERCFCGDIYRGSGADAFRRDKFNLQILLSVIGSKWFVCSRLTSAAQ